jgi:nucleotide-binding universal stress UspA family protein
MFKTILLPIDIAEPEAAAPAIERATALAQASGGTIRLIYARPIFPETWMEFVPPHFDEAQRASADAKISEIAARIPLPEERVSSIVRMGSVRQQVLREAERIGADLIVVGSHRPAASTYLLGSNAATVVRHALCSVLVVR